MKNVYILYIVFFIPSFVTAQENLIPNPGFEDSTYCYDNNTKESRTLVNDWGRPINQDTFTTNRCDTAWHIYLKAKEARSGSAVQYFLAWYDNPRSPNSVGDRSYIIAHLKKPLVAGYNYYFRMYVKAVFNNLENYSLCNNQAVAFTQTVPKPPEQDGPLNLVPVVQYEKLVDTTWTKVSGCFLAKGNEEYVIIGNFAKQNATKIKRLGTVTPVTANIPGLNIDFTNTTLTASYIVDDVELLQLSADYPLDTAICQGESFNVNLKNNLTATYKWQDGSTSPQYVITKTGHYKAQINYTINGEPCTIEQNIKVTVLPRYDVKAPVDTTICNYRSILLKTGKGRRDDTIVWLEDNSRHDTLRVSKSGIYNVQITNSCGIYKESYKIDFVNCTIDVFVPNAFSPNGDNINDTFAPFVQAAFPITNYEFAVYNRWGSRLFFSNEINATWDGTFQNKPVESGVYIWYLVTRGTVGSKKLLKEEGGDVTLIR